MDATERRQLLTTVANPDPRSEFIVGLRIETAPMPGIGALRVELRYVPDKRMVEPSCLRRYLEAVAARQGTRLESLALVLRDDINNEVVPRWLEIFVCPGGIADGEAQQSLLIQDRQPNWENPALLARLKPC